MDTFNTDIEKLQTAPPKHSHKLSKILHGALILTGILAVSSFYYGPEVLKTMGCEMGSADASSQALDFQEYDFGFSVEPVPELEFVENADGEFEFVDEDVSSSEVYAEEAEEAEETYSEPEHVPVQEEQVDEEEEQDGIYGGDLDLIDLNSRYVDSMDY